MRPANLGRGADEVAATKTKVAAAQKRRSAKPTKNLGAWPTPLRSQRQIRGERRGQVPEAAAFVTIANRSLLNEAWRKLLQIQFPSLPGRRGTRQRQVVQSNEGVGFIVGSGEEIFVHQRCGSESRGQRGNLRDGQAVSFVVVETTKGQADGHRLS